MASYSVWAYFVCMVILLAIVAAPVFQAADTPPNPRGNRNSALDGLRGFLALGVFFHHTAIYRRYLIDGRWVLPPSQFYSLLGQVGVAMFFMITGYLFWPRMIKEKGRPDWVRLYTGRVFRIGPLYLLATLVMFAIVIDRTLQLNVPLLTLTRQVARWLLLGFFGNGTSVNAYTDATLVMGVVWTLQLEWMFYISLLATSFAARHAKTHLLFIAAGWISSLTYIAIWHVEWVLDIASPPVCTALFFTGMICASLTQNDLTPKLANRTASILVVALTGAVFCLFPSANHAAPIVLMGFAFFLIVSGCDVFGLLSSRPVRRLGNVSYGIYLLHMLLLSVVFSLGSVVTFALRSPLQYWAVVLLSAVVLVILATAAHVWIERPGIELGNRVGILLAAKNERVKSAFAKFLASQRAS
jgi:peptidoglycan/LPS O-acetylase OafA/YrhL